MCYKGKCFYCIPVEYGCLVFAVLSAIFTLIALLACVITGLLAVTGLIVASDQLDYSRHTIGIIYPDQETTQNVKLFGGVAISIITFIASIPSLIAFIFSVLLCNGICKRRPGQVKAYFIYGVVITVLAVAAAILQVVTSFVPDLGIAGLVGCVIYALILWMVFETYTKLSAGTVFKDHIRLIEQY